MEEFLGDIKEHEPGLAEYDRVVQEKVRQLQQEGGLPSILADWSHEHIRIYWRIVEAAGVEMGLWEPLPSFKEKSKDYEAGEPLSSSEKIDPDVQV